MNTAELKLNLFREIDALEKSKLEQVYGILLNFMNKNNDEDDWNSLSNAQKNGLLDAVNEMSTSDGIDSDVLLKKYTDRYA